MREGGATADNLADSNKQQCSLHSLLTCANLLEVLPLNKEETIITTQDIMWWSRKIWILFYLQSCKTIKCNLYNVNLNLNTKYPLKKDLNLPFKVMEVNMWWWKTILLYHYLNIMRYFASILGKTYLTFWPGSEVSKGMQAFQTLKQNKTRWLEKVKNMNSKITLCSYVTRNNVKTRL